MNARTHRRSQVNRLLKWIAAGVLLAGLFVQITQLSRISAQAKQTDAAAEEITLLSARVDNLQVALTQYTRLSRIEERAKALDMRWPDESQLRVLNLPELVQTEDTHTADNIGAASTAQ